MGKIINTIMGDLSEKKAYKDNEKRAKSLPSEYYEAYKNIQQYLWKTSGIISIQPFISLVDLFEEAAASGRKVVDITGQDVAAFADELVRGEKSYKDNLRKKLNNTINNKES